jgi:hypothetical protein
MVMHLGKLDGENDVLRIFKVIPDFQGNGVV